MTGRLQRMLDRAWYGDSRWTRPLAPLAALTRAVASKRLERHLRNPLQPPIPVIVVGNITAGGTGKTPLVAMLARHALSQGLRPVIISRGYRARPPYLPWLVEADQSAEVAGDEPLLLATETGVPVIIDPDRPRALAQAISKHAADLVISDDGLQHFALPRSYEIVVIDGQRGLGNGLCLPAGPLREPVERLDKVDLLVVNGEPAAENIPKTALQMDLLADQVVSLMTQDALSLKEFVTRHPRVHAVAGIGNPGRFFSALEAQGFEVDGRAFPDHHAYIEQDVRFDDALPVLMTSKDAVKCRAFAGQGHWVVPVRASLPENIVERIFAEALLS